MSSCVIIPQELERLIPKNAPKHQTCMICTKQTDGYCKEYGKQVDMFDTCPVHSTFEYGMAKVGSSTFMKLAYFNTRDHLNMVLDGMRNTILTLPPCAVKA